MLCELSAVVGTIDDTMPVMSQAELSNVIDNILRLDDTDDNGMIDYSEFVTAMRRNIERYCEWQIGGCRACLWWRDGTMQCTVYKLCYSAVQC